jgi:RNA polymerase sigma-70 factor, ECF subfamily
LTTRGPLAALPAAAAVLGNAPAAAAEAGAKRLDEAAFRDLYAEAARPLWAYLASASGDPTLAEDLVQESFLRLLRAAGVPRDPAHLRGYLFRTATNLLRDHRRWRRRRREEPPEEAHTAPATEGGEQGEAGLRHDLQRFLARLEPRARKLLWLAHVEGWSHAEIAAAVGLREVSVRVLLFRARRRLAALLRAAGYANERF